MERSCSLWFSSEKNAKFEDDLVTLLYRQLWNKKTFMMKLAFKILWMQKHTTLFLKSTFTEFYGIQVMCFFWVWLQDIKNMQKGILPKIQQYWEKNLKLWRRLRRQTNVGFLFLEPKKTRKNTAVHTRGKFTNFYLAPPVPLTQLTEAISKWF